VPKLCLEIFLFFLFQSPGGIARHNHNCHHITAAERARSSHLGLGCAAIRGTEQQVTFEHHTRTAAAGTNSQPNVNTPQHERGNSQCYSGVLIVGISVLTEDWLW